MMIGAKNRLIAMQREDESAKYHFILDEYDARRGNQDKPESQRYRTAARQHVMRGVGSSKRKAKRSKPMVFELVPRRHTIAGDPQELQYLSSGDKEHWDSRTTLFSGQQRFDFEGALITPPETPMEDVNASRHVSLSPLRSTIQKDARLDSFVAWPIEMTPRMRFLMDYVLTTNCTNVRLFRSVGWPLLDTDPGILYNTLGVAALCLSHRSVASQRKALSSEALFYWNEGISSINARLGDQNRRNSDGMLTSIMAMATQNLSPLRGEGWCWELAKSDQCKDEDREDQWHLHLNAMKTILAGRGGVESIDSKGPMRTWLYLIDLEGAVTRDAVPYFPLPQHLLPKHRFRWPGNRDVANAATNWMQEFSDHPAAIRIWLDLDSRIEHLRDRLAAEGDDLWSHHEVDLLELVPLVHRCLQLAGIESTEVKLEHDDESSVAGPIFQDALRHAIILFLAPVRRKFGHPAAGLELHVSKLKNALRDCLNQQSALLMQPIIYWMLVAGAMEACNLGRDECWYFSRILDCCMIMGAKRFEDVKTVTQHARFQLVWLDETMDKSFASMLEKIRVYMEALNASRDWK